MRTIQWIFCCGVALWPLWGGAEIYQSRGASGNIVYSDRPLGTNSHKTEITSPPAGQAPPAPSVMPAQNDKATSVEDPEIRKARCAKIRELLGRYQKAEYLARESSDGKSTILSDQEKDKEVEQLKEQEAAQCDS